MYRLDFALPQAQAEALFAALEALEEPPFSALSLCEHDDKLWEVMLYVDQLPKGLAGLGLDAAPFQGFDLAGAVVVPVGEQDWVARVQAGLPPVRAGRFLVHGSHDAGRIGCRPFAIKVDAAQAFGTAHHGTTQACLQAIDWLSRLQGVRFCRILDLGTGSGVLAISAAKVFLCPVLASDYDPVAVEIARKNVLANGVARKVRAVQAVGLSHAMIRKTAPFDLVMANILAEPLKQMAPDFRRALASCGWLLLSGLLAAQRRNLVARFSGFGFVLQKSWCQQGWSTLLLRKKCGGKSGRQRKKARRGEMEPRRASLAS